MLDVLSRTMMSRNAPAGGLLLLLLLPDLSTHRSSLQPFVTPRPLAARVLPSIDQLKHSYLFNHFQNITSPTRIHFFHLL